MAAAAPTGGDVASLRAASDMLWITNVPPGRTVGDLVELLAPFGVLATAQVVTAEEANQVLPPRRRRPKLPPAAANDDDAPVSSPPAAALVRFEEDGDAGAAAANLDGAVYWQHELVCGVMRVA